jgi:hypothetical protein
MKSVKIGFSRPKAWFVPYSWLIRLADRCAMSHVYIRYTHEETGQQMIFQASGHNVNEFNASIFESIEVITAEFEHQMNDEEYSRFLNFKDEKLGIPYGVLNVLGSTLYLLFKWNPFGDGGATEVCSKLVEEVFQFPIDVPVNDCRPFQIYQYLLSTNK